MKLVYIEYIRGKQKKVPRSNHGGQKLIMQHGNYTLADLTVLMMRAATLYGSAAEFGRRSSR